MMSTLVIAIGVLATLALVCFSIGLAAGAFMMITDTRTSAPLTLHEGGIWLAIRILWILAFLLMVVEEELWVNGSRRPLPTGILLSHLASIVFFLWSAHFAKKNNGRHGMKIHLFFGVPCSVSFFTMIATGFMLFTSIAK